MYTTNHTKFIEHRNEISLVHKELNSSAIIVHEHVQTIEH